MTKLLLLRHLLSQWNKENRFAGWADVPLSQEGIASAEETAEKLQVFQIDKVYTSPLIRNRETVSLVIRKDIPIIIDKALDERNYGALQGLNRDEVKKQYGDEKVRLWRRSWRVAPPGGESLKDVYERAVPFFKKCVEKDLQEGRNVLVVASHNSLRAIIKYVEKISDQDIINTELAYAELRVYAFDRKRYTKII